MHADLQCVILNLGTSSMNYYESLHTTVTNLCKVPIKTVGAQTIDLTQAPTALWIGKKLTTLICNRFTECDSLLVFPVDLIKIESKLVSSMKNMTLKGEKTASSFTSELKKAFQKNSLKHGFRTIFLYVTNGKLLEKEDKLKDVLKNYNNAMIISYAHLEEVFTPLFSFLFYPANKEPLVVNKRKHQKEEESESEEEESKSEEEESESEEEVISCNTRNKQFVGRR
jgi:hypothetical protein